MVNASRGTTKLAQPIYRTQYHNILTFFVILRIVVVFVVVSCVLLLFTVQMSKPQQQIALLLVEMTIATSFQFNDCYCVVYYLHYYS